MLLPWIFPPWPTWLDLSNPSSSLQHRQVDSIPRWRGMFVSMSYYFYIFVCLISIQKYCPLSLYLFSYKPNFYLISEEYPLPPKQKAASSSSSLSMRNKDLMKGRWYHPQDHHLMVQIILFQLLLVLLILLISSMPTWHRLNNHQHQLLLWALLKSKEILHLMILCQWDAIFKTYLPIHLRQSTRIRTSTSTNMY